MPPPRTQRQQHRPHDIACVVHVHSTFSDGTATVEEIIGAARAAGADAVLLTDHDSLQAARCGLEGWHDGVLLLVGHEITTRGGHFLAFGLDREVEHGGLSERAICETVRARGGFGFAAHPFSKGGLIKSVVRPHPWNALEDCAPHGIELWSLTTDTAERWHTPAAALGFLRDPEGSLTGPPAEHLAAWDRLCSVRRVPAIGGLDAHQTGIRVAGHVLSPMPNERYFRLLRTHVFLDGPPRLDLRADRDAVYRGLREGRCYLSIDALADPRGFDCFATDPGGRRAPLGSEITAGPWTISAHSPRPATLRLLRDGHPVHVTHGHLLEHDIGEAGVYRIEVVLTAGGRERTWILTNPIYVRAVGTGSPSPPRC